MSLPQDDELFPDDEAASPPALDAGLGLAFALGGVALLVASGRFTPMVPDTRIGPGFMPFICAIVFMVLGAVLAFSGLRRMRSGEAVAQGEPGGTLAYGAVVMGGLVLVVVLTPWLGFILASTLYSLAVTRAGGGGWIGSAVMAFAVTMLVYLLFSQLMRVPLPGFALF